MKTEGKKIMGVWSVQFTQGVQTFTIVNLEKTKRHAIWQKEMLDKAFENYSDEILKEQSRPSDIEQPRECTLCKYHPNNVQPSVSAEEILYRTYGCSDGKELRKFFSFSDKSVEMILEAMEEYASLRQPKRERIIEVLEKHLPRFDNEVRIIDAIADELLKPE